ncbi:hypothetical protein AB0L65_07895 [Nonomuraea sp. NPDC052116]|uniref:hypothetical protein n=1 Tax=Nonomuraea sp. NPDC052116 TaxID=3155665 RepID=UPI00342429CD
MPSACSPFGSNGCHPGTGTAEAVGDDCGAALDTAVFGEPAEDRGADTGDGSAAQDASASTQAISIVLLRKILMPAHYGRALPIGYPGVGAIVPTHSRMT